MGDYLAVLAAAGGLAGLGALLLNRYHYVERRLEREERYRAGKAAELRKPTAGRLYRRALHRGLRFFRRWMGQPASGRAFNVCLALSLAYSVLFFLIGWAAGGLGTLGAVELLPEDRSTLFRLLLTLGLVGFGAVIGGVLYASEAIDAALESRLARLLARAGRGGSPRLARWLYRGLGAIAVASIFGALYVGAVIGGGFAGAGAGAVALIALGRELSDPILVIFLLFFLILPFTNALYDWFSWWISRSLGEHLFASLRRFVSPWRKLAIGAGHTLLDLGAALVLLVALVFTLPLVIEGYNALAAAWGAEPPLLLGTFPCAAARDPWGAGLWVTLMVLSTLVPTALHLTAAVASPVAYAFVLSDRWRVVATELGRPKPEPACLSEAANHFGVVRPLIWVGAAGFLLVVSYLVIRGIAHAAEPVTELLLGVALRDFAAAQACFAGASAPLS